MKHNRHHKGALPSFALPVLPRKIVIRPNKQTPINYKTEVGERELLTTTFQDEGRAPHARGVERPGKMPSKERRAEVLRPAALKVVNPATMKLPGAINTFT